ncbi:DUF3641 domain-containing protein [Methylotuvimicrobium sp. KM1]|uniref:DUF3641 domain-containing protein n=1 Tax=Methylotuvimicrobium sp. KM1 TaxID=3377707 RepID=UPI00384BA5A5
MGSTTVPLVDNRFPRIRRNALTTLQLNLGYVGEFNTNDYQAIPLFENIEWMAREVMESAVKFAVDHRLSTIDMTGIAPEMHPDFRWLVTTAKRRGMHIKDRCNPGLLVKPGYEWLAGFMAEQHVELVAGLDCLINEDAESYFDNSVFFSVIQGLRSLNELGYGMPDSGLILKLSCKPHGAFMPNSQKSLEYRYRERLKDEFGIYFNAMCVMTNMPMSYFGSKLLAHGRHEDYLNVVFGDYLRLLKDAFHPDNLGKVMCKSLISIDQLGFVYDCDFNRMLKLQLSQGEPVHIFDLSDKKLESELIHVAEHCFGCTAGQGSGCNGALR